MKRLETLSKQGRKFILVPLVSALLAACGGGDGGSGGGYGNYSGGSSTGYVNYGSNSSSSNNTVTTGNYEKIVGKEEIDYLKKIRTRNSLSSTDNDIPLNLAFDASTGNNRYKTIYSAYENAKVAANLKFRLANIPVSSVTFDTSEMNISRSTYKRTDEVDLDRAELDEINYRKELKDYNRLDHVLKYYKSYSSYAVDIVARNNINLILRGHNTASADANYFFSEATVKNYEKTYYSLYPNFLKRQKLIIPLRYTDYNKYDIFATGLTNVYLRDEIVKTETGVSENSIGYTPTQKSTKAPQGSFEGSGVRVLVLDVNPHLYQDRLYKKATEVNVAESFHNTRNREGTGLEEHGAVVSQVIAAPRTTSSKVFFFNKLTYTGVAPRVDLFYFGVNLRDPSEQQHRARYKAIVEANPDIVNMSYGSGADISQTSDFYNAFGTYLSPFKYEEAARKLAISKGTRSPLFVIAAGNWDPTSNNPRFNYKPALEEALTSGNPILNFTDPGFGLAIDNKELNFLNIADNVLADHTIIVTGVTNAKSQVKSPTTQTYDKREDMKIARRQVVAKLIAKESNQDRKNYYSRQLDIALQNANSFQHKAFVNANEDLKEALNNLFADPGAVRCGVALYSCIAAPFTYVLDDERYSKGKHKLSGTSFSSPYVSAVAALVKEQFPWFTAKQLKETLLSTATDLGKMGVDPVYGWGIVNAEAALNGPRMFLYGNFKADMSRSRYSNANYYFNNNIFGSAGLEVRGRSGDKLFLTGNSGYLGDTVVNSGNLYLVAGKKLGIPYSNDLASITSTVTTGKSGRFYAYDAALYGLNNFGYAELTNTKIKNDLVTYSGSTLTLTAGAPVGVAGKATINEGSKLVVLATNSVASSGYNYQQLLAANGGVNGQFSTVDLSRVRRNALSSYGVAYTQRGVFLANRNYNIQTAGVTLASYTGTDTSAILAGANNLNSLYETLGFDENAVTVHNEVDFTAAGVTSTSEDELVSTSQAEAGESVAKANELVNLEVKVTDTVTVPELKLAEAVSLASTEDTDNSNSGNTNTDNGNTNTANSTNSNATDTTSTNPVLAKLVAGLQNATNNQLSAVFYSASLPAYSELTLLQSVQTTSRVQGFSNRILGDTATTKFNLYLDFEPQYRNISHSSTKARGKYTGNSGVIGVYGKYEDYLLGAAYFHGKSNYEQSYLGFATATGTVAGNGLSINLGKQLTAAQYLTANLYFSHDNYKLNRLIGYTTTNSTSTPVFSYAKYSTNQYGIDLAWKGQLWQQANQSLSLTTRVNLNQLTQQAFREQVPEGLESLAYNLTKQKHTKLLAQVAVNYTNSFTLAEHKLQLNLGASLTYDSRYSSVTAYKVVGTNQATNKELSTANQNQALAPFLVQTQAELGYELSEKVKLGVGSKFSFAKNYRDWNANANLTVGF